MWNHFAEVRRLGGGLSQGKLSRAMVEVMLQLPSDVAPSKEVVVQYLGLIGQVSTTRDINAAWTSAKKQVLRDYPGQYCLVGKALRRAPASGAGRATERLSAAGLRKLAALAAKEGVSPDEMLGELIAAWRAARK